MILKIEMDPARFQVVLRGEKVCPAGAKREVQHSKVIRAVACRGSVLPGREKGEGGAAFAQKYRHTFPHPFMSRFETEDVDIPLHRALDVAHRECDVVDPFQLEHTRQIGALAAWRKHPVATRAPDGSLHLRRPAQWLA